MKDYSETRQLHFKNPPTHLNQQLAAQLEHFCVKLLGNCKKVNPEIFFLHYYMAIARSAREDICTFSRNLTALGIRNALSSVESSIQVQFLRFLYMPPC